jgi:EmrB/QacA subfamily drug resistance transporter
MPISTPPTGTPTKQNKNAILVLACLAQFMVILDVFVVNVALPDIRRALGFSQGDLQWVVNAYTVTFGGFLLLGGRAADLLGRRRVFVFGLLLFSVASMAAGLADTRAELIIARLVQGLGGAVIAPASLSILTTTFTEPAERHRAIGIWGAVGGAGGAAGVLLGGAVVEALNWRWVFYINVPIGLVCAVLAAYMIAESFNPNATRAFDAIGAVLATVGLSLLVFGIVRTDTTGWGDATTLALIIAGVVVLAGFLINEGRFAKAPLMPLRLFRSRSLSGANVIVMIIGASTFGMWFFFSLYLQQVRGYSPLHAGLVFLPMTLALMIGGVIASRLTARVGARRLLILGMSLLTAGLTLFSQVHVHTHYFGVTLAASMLASIGMPLAFIPSTILATSGIAQNEAGIASAILNTARMFGGALGLAVLVALATTHSNHLLKNATASVHTVNHALVSGYDLAFLVAACMAAAGILVAAFVAPKPTADRREGTELDGVVAPPAIPRATPSVR